MIFSTKTTERLTRKLQRNGIRQWVAETTGDRWGRFLRFAVGGPCIGGCGWSVRQAVAIVDHLIAYRDCDEMPPFPD